MSLLIPLGLLGLLGLLVLLIIYLIKPNYQQKLVSSTFVWKLSLKYQKKRIPISKLRNILILICQILILTFLALILTQPAILDETDMRDNEKIVIIDASASMLATTRYDDSKYTRFERAVDEVAELAETTFKKGGTLTIIIAGEEAAYLSEKYPDVVNNTNSAGSGDTADSPGTGDTINRTEAVVDSAVEFYRVDADSQDLVLSKLEELKVERDEHKNPKFCTYGKADIQGAMDLAGHITTINPKAEVMLYTGKKYLNNNGVTVKDMSRRGEELNVAILDVRAVMEEGYYTFYADVVSYGANAEAKIEWNINVDVYSADGNSEYAEPVREIFYKDLREGEVTTIIFDTNSKYRVDGTPRPVTDYVYEYVSATVTTIVEGDAITEDNSVTLYGGVKPTLKVQYASTKPNIFFSSALMSLANALRNRWDLDIDEVRGTSETPQTSGYDFYIFEYRMPAEIPTDGVVLLVNPSALPNGTGVLLGNGVSGSEKYLVAPEAHPLVNFMNVSNLLVTSYNPINTYPEGYTTVIQCDNRPVLICKNTADEKIGIMTFSLNYSDIAVKIEFPTFVYNLFEYFIPSTFTQFIFEVNDDVTLKARSASLTLSVDGVDRQFNSFPAQYHLTSVGAYTTKQKLFGNDKVITESFFVKMPAAESDIGMVFDLIPGSVVKTIPETTFDDLLIYFAAALVLLLFVEWWLQSRSGI